MIRRLSCAAALFVAVGASASGGEGQPADPLQGLRIEVAGDTRRFDAIEVTGLRTITEPELWAAVARPQPPFAFAEAATLVRALDASQAFARVEPRVRVSAAGEVTLAIAVAEHPLLRAVSVEGVTEVRVDEVARDLLGGEAGASFFAHSGSEGVRTGVLRGGVQGAVRRAVAGLFERGYLMAGAHGDLSRDGVLTIAIDEGRLSDVRVEGPDARLGPAVVAALDLPKGRIFVASELTDAVKRVEREFPFLHPRLAVRPSRSVPRVEAVQDDSGETRFATRTDDPAPQPGFFTVEGQQVTFFFESKRAFRAAIATDELLRHTPVGGIGVGTRAELRIYDPKNRLHFTIDTFSSVIDGDALEAVDEDGGEYATALRLRAPLLWNAELNLETHATSDTFDSWRTSRQTAYVNSLVFNQPDAEYFWHVGSSLGLTLLPREGLLLSVEHWTDRYRSMPSLRNPNSLFNGDEPFTTPAINDGEVGSLLLRAELHSEPVRPVDIRGLFHTPETSVVKRPRVFGVRTGYRLLASLEMAREGLGSQKGFAFTKLVSDNMAFLATGAESGLRLRARIAGGQDLPLQKQEALGGWSALRGHDFKEYRGGDWSVLATGEYRHEWLAGFVDVGALRRDATWSPLHAGAGLKLHPDSLPLVGSWLRRQRLLPPCALAVAWRLDRPSAGPAVRFLVNPQF